MNKAFSVLNVTDYDADTLKEFFGADLQVMFAEDFFNIPERYTYKNLTVDFMVGYGMIDRLDERVLEEAKRQWDDNQQEIYGAWDEQPLDSRVAYFEEIAYNWR